MGKDYEGGCFCRRVRFAATGAPLLVELCHCRSCRKASGAPVFAWAAFATERFRLTAGTPHAHASSPGVVRTFCRECGTPLTLSDDNFPGEGYVALATLDDPESLPPAFHIWRSHRLSWLETADDLPRYRRFKFQGDVEDPSREP